MAEEAHDQPQESPKSPSPEDKLYKLTIEELIPIYLVKKAQEEWLKWIKNQTRIIVVFLSLIVTVCAFFGYKGYNLVDRLERSGEMLNNAEIAYATVDTLMEKISLIETQIIRLNSEFHATEDKKLMFEQNLASTRNALDGLMKELSQSQLKSKIQEIQKIYDEENRALELKKANFEENRSFTVLIRYSADVQQRTQICNNILTRNGFRVDLKEMNEVDAIAFRKQNYSNKIVYSINNLSNKASEIVKALRELGSFMARKEDLSIGDYSFIVWILN